ncbi:hypothetical protein, partial [Prevotella pallens]|uniref:hypothetical protein n=2 Tax=Prevotella pallens TaxID=60133 RepID=UPI0028E4CE12
KIIRTEEVNDMKDNKKVYSQPQTTLLYMENQEMICSSVQPNPSSSIQTDNGYNNGGEHNGGGEGNDL